MEFLRRQALPAPKPPVNLALASGYGVAPQWELKLRRSYNNSLAARNKPCPPPKLHIHFTLSARSGPPDDLHKQATTPHTLREVSFRLAPIDMMSSCHDCNSTTSIPSLPGVGQWRLPPHSHMRKHLPCQTRNKVVLLRIDSGNIRE